MSKPTAPAIDGWFTLGDAPRLIGSQCPECHTYFFPKRTGLCANPACTCSELVETELSRTGKIWSYADSRYAPPPPYIKAEPYEPFAIAAVELEREKIVILGQMTQGTTVNELAVGQAVELALETLYEDDDNAYVVWKWRLTEDA